MNIGIRLHDTAPGTLGQRLGFARSQGFSCVHLALSKVLPDFKMADAPAKLDASMAEQVRGAFVANRVDCAVLGCYLKLACPDEEELRRTQEIYRAHLRFSRMIGAGVVGTETPPAASAGMSAREIASDEALELFIRCAAPLARCAEEEGTVQPCGGGVRGRRSPPGRPRERAAHEGLCRSARRAPTGVHRLRAR